MSPEQALALATARWPSWKVERAFLARLAEGVVELESPDAFEAEDFYLATAALEAVPAAVREVQALVALQFSALGGFRLSRAELEDLEATLFAELLTTTPSAPPRLSRYLGRGPLGGWLRVTAAHRAVSFLRRQRRTVSADDDALLGSLEAPSEVPELAALKSRYRGVVSQAFKAAIAGLEVRERNLLRQHYLDQLTLEELAALYRVHRATAARWLANARVSLLEQTRTRVGEALNIPRADVDSLMRVVQSRLDLSAGLFLTSSATP